MIDLLLPHDDQQLVWEQQGELHNLVKDDHIMVKVQLVLMEELHILIQ